MATNAVNCSPHIRKSKRLQWVGLLAPAGDKKYIHTFYRENLSENTHFGKKY
jgi:hypothetical protein